MPYLLNIFMIDEFLVLSRPILRGKVHLIWLFLSPIWLGLLLRECETGAAYAGTVVASFVMIFNCLCSAILHHSRTPYPRIFTTYRRLDHCGIFLMISLSCFSINTIITTGVLRIAYTTTMLSFTVLGICSIYFNLLQVRPIARSMVYVFVGLTHTMIVPACCHVLNWTELLCLLGLASSYIAGSLFYGMRWSFSKNSYIGFHEIFHFHCLIAMAFTVAFNIFIIRNHQFE